MEPLGAFTFVLPRARRAIRLATGFMRPIPTAPRDKAGPACGRGSANR